MKSPKPPTAYCKEVSKRILPKMHKELFLHKKSHIQISLMRFIKIGLRKINNLSKNFTLINKIKRFKESRIRNKLRNKLHRRNSVN